MNDRDKTYLLKELTRAIDESDPTAAFCLCQRWILKDALSMLKEQEPVKAVADGEDSYRCTNCGTVIGWDEWEPGGIEEVKYKFCPECGRSVKWNE